MRCESFKTSQTRACILILFCAAGLVSSDAQSVFFTSLAAFNWTNGAYPPAAMVQAHDGNFYGITMFGGPASNGTVFRVTPTGMVTTLHGFCYQPNCADGENPYGALIQASDRNFYGTTSVGGTTGSGTIFKITAAGTLTTLYTFCSQADCTDGGAPQGGLLQATDGNLYGTTAVGGVYSWGTVFRLTPEGALTTLHSFNSSDGAEPYASLVQDSDGNFYGTTAFGGAEGNGTVFRVTPGGAFTTLHSFGGLDGSFPYSTLIQTNDGNFYGTTHEGGSHGSGTVFKITSSGTLTMLYSFCAHANCTDGAGPQGGLVQATDGNFYGTTGGGGQYRQCNGYGCGTVFRITPAGVLTTLHSFNYSDGAGPLAALVQGTDGNLYGTTWGGGPYNDGTVFRQDAVRPCATCRP